MSTPPAALRKTLTWAELLPSILAGAWVVLLFTAAVLLARAYSAPILAVLQAHPRLAIVVFLVTTVVAVLAPFLTNLPLVPLAVLAWGPAWTAFLLLAGWVTGAALAFVLGRHAGRFILRHFPSATRHANIDRLIHPGHRLVSLIMLRMTFPVDVLSYALGMFSRSTTLTENVLSTALGAAPFAVLFALFPALSATSQLIMFGVCTLLFGAHILWVLRHVSGTGSERVER
jgi:uncharacterized membrane protein YdjX (TVP38/TMEM64 family)